jgi:hypothetical protein
VFRGVAKSAMIEDSTYDGTRLLRLTGLTAPEVVYDNEEGTVHAVGPGEVRVVQRGDSNERIATPGPPQLPQANKAANKDTLVGT